MKKFHLFWLIIYAFSLGACADSDLLDPYFGDKPRILAVKVQNPEAAPGDTVSMKILVGGKTVEQDTANTVFWAIDDVELESIGVSNYNQEFTYQIPMDLLGENEWYDLPVYARIQVDQKYLNAQKLLRLTRNPIAKNPVISDVRIRYFNGNQQVSDTVADGGLFTLPANVDNVAFTANTEQLAPGENDKLVYRWYISTGKTTGGMLYVQDDEDKIERLLGDGADASELYPSVVFSLKGEDNDRSFQTGVYDVYLVVRDNASNPQSMADERHGTDFIYFTLECR